MKKIILLLVVVSTLFSCVSLNNPRNKNYCPNRKLLLNNGDPGGKVKA